MRSIKHVTLGAIVAGATLSYAVAIPAVADEDPADPEPVPSSYLFEQFQEQRDQFPQPVDDTSSDVRRQQRLDEAWNVEIQQRIDEATWNLRGRIDPNTIEPYDFHWVGYLINEWSRTEVEFPSACEMRRRLQAEVDDLTERATKGFLQMEDIAALQERIIDARLDIAIHNLQRQKEALEKLQEEFGDAAGDLMPVNDAHAEVVRLLYERAEAAKGDSKAEVVRDRLVQRVDEVMKHAYQTVGSLQQLRVELVTERLLRAKALFDEHASRMGVSRRDYDRVIELWLDRARAIANEPFPTCQ